MVIAYLHVLNSCVASRLGIFVRQILDLWGLISLGTLSDTTPCTMRNFPFMKKSKDKKSKAAKEAASPKATPKKQEEDEMASRTLRQIPRRIFHVQSSCSC
jgi:hypothetical protein